MYTRSQAGTPGRPPPRPSMRPARAAASAASGPPQRALAPPDAPTPRWSYLRMTEKRREPFFGPCLARAA